MQRVDQTPGEGEPSKQMERKCENWVMNGNPKQRRHCKRKAVEKEKRHAEGGEYRAPGARKVEGVTSEEERSGGDGRGAPVQQRSGQGPAEDSAAATHLPPASHGRESTCAAGHRITL